MRYFIFIISIAVILSGLVMGLRYFLIDGESSPVKKESVPSSLSAPSSEGSVHRIVEEQEVTIPTVTYSQGKFSPSSLNIKSEMANGSCLLTVINSSDQPLTVRLSPHDPKDEWGFPYPTIPPGEKSIIDPRYRIPEIVFHNHEKPHEEFEVILGKDCL